MRTVSKRTITFEVKRHDFENEFAYVEVWRNSSLTDCFFAYKEDINPDGSLKGERAKFFFSKDGREKYVSPIDFVNFESFNMLCSLDVNGEIILGESFPKDYLE